MFVIEMELQYELCDGYGTTSVYVFYPTMTQISDFPSLIQLIEATGAHNSCGICKIVPPPEWNPRPSKKSFKDIDEFLIMNPANEKNVLIRTGIYQKELSRYKKEISVKEFRQLANTSTYRNPHPELDHVRMDDDFWRSIEDGEAIYGADTEGSLFDEDVNEFNMSRLGTLLDNIGEKIHGVNTVYLYFGMYKTMFPWHAEDMDLYSINYLHDGAPKHWWAVPGQTADRFERFMQQQFPEEAKLCSAFLRHKNFIANPSLLRSHNIPYGAIVQKKNEFIITFPRGFHQGYNTGYNIAESTNFATDRWVDFAKNAINCKCRSDAVEIDMRSMMKLYRPDEYEEWLSYWYIEKTVSVTKTLAKSAKKKRSSKGMKEDNCCPGIRKRDYEGLWARDAPDLFKERQYNERRALLSPHCSVCQAFIPEDSLYATSVVPSRSLRVVRNESFSKCKYDEPTEIGMEHLVQCENCGVCVHSACYSVSTITANFRCLRCREQDDTRIRSSSCVLCQLRGGALIKAQIGGQHTFVHIVCAIMNRRTFFCDPTMRITAYIQPAPKHGITQRYVLNLLAPEYAAVYGDTLEKSKYQCVVCGHLGEGLLKCHLCINSPQLEPTIAHATCARAAGMALEMRDFPQVAVLQCNKHELASEEKIIPIGQKVNIKLKSGFVKEGVVVDTVGDTYLSVDFLDDTTSENTLASDIYSCFCRPNCRTEGHVPNTFVTVHWNDGKLYPAYYRKTITPTKMCVRFSDGEQIEVPTSCLTLLDEHCDETKKRKME